MNMTWKILIAFVGTAVVVGGLTYFFVQQKFVGENNALQIQIDDLSEKSNDSGIVVPVDESADGPSVVQADELIDWETYINTKYGFSFRHPSDWTVAEEIPASYMNEPWISYQAYFTYTQPGGQDNTGYVAVSKKSISEVEKAEMDAVQYSDESVTFTGVPATKATWTYSRNDDDTEYSSTGYNYYIVRNGYTYTVTGIETASTDGENEQANQEIQNKIIGSFRFN